MASTPKPEIETWQKDWQGRKVWAQNNGIPFNDFQQAVQFDYKRLTNPEGYGKPMGDTEAFDALTSLKEGHDPFTTPATSGPPTFLSSPFKAVENNLQNIFTGLFHAPEQIGKDITDAIHGHYAGILNLVPGYTDITDLFTSQGRSYLDQNPISDMLDFGGLGKMFDIAETGMRQAGLDSAADTLKSIPDHPLSSAIKATTAIATDKFATLARLRDGTLSILRSGGLTKDVQENILRPSRAFKNQMMNVPHPSFYLESIHDFKPTFGWLQKLPSGMNVVDYQKFLAKNLTTQDMNDINQVITTSSFREGAPGSMTVSAYLDDPQFSLVQKTAMRAQIKGLEALKMAEFYNEEKIKPVYHETTGEEGTIKTTGSPWEEYTTRLAKLRDTAEKAQTAYRSSLTTIYDITNKLRTEDSNLPRALNWDPDTPKPYPTALLRVGDFYRINKEQLFRMMPGSFRTLRRDTKGITPGTSPGKAELMKSYRTAAETQSFDTFSSRLDKTFGHNSNLHHIIDDISSLRGVADSEKLANDIKKFRSDLRRLSLPNSEIIQWLDHALDDIRDSSILVRNQWLSLSKLKTDAEHAQKAVDTQAKRYDVMWYRHTQARFQPIVQAKGRQLIAEYFHDHYLTGEIHIPARLAKKLSIKEITPDIVAKAYDDIQLNMFSSPEVSILIPRTDMIEMTNSAYLFIKEAKMNGANPLFVTGISSEEREAIERGGVSSDLSHFVNRSVTRNRQPLISDTIYNTWLAIPKEAMDIYRERTVSHLLNEFFIPRALRDQDIAELAKTFFFHYYSPDLLNNLPEMIKQWARDNNYTVWDPTNPLGIVKRGFTSVAEDSSTNRLWIHKNDLDLIKGTFKEMDANLNRIYNTVMQIYRTGVLYASPRYFAHITLGGGLLTVLRMSNPIISVPRYFAEAMDIARNQEKLPVMVSKGVGEQGIHGELVENPLAAHNHLAGAKAGKLYTEAFMKRTGLDHLSSGLTMYKDFIEKVTTFQRALVYLEGKAKATEADFTDDVRNDAKRWNMTPSEVVGARLANKALADMMIVSPMERTVLMRYFMPFWGWTRHILRYVTTFPSDYPLRTSIINTLTQQAIGDGSNLPDYLYRLLFLGQPNAQGSITVLDTRQWNPFRDVANYMTGAGIVSSLNPIIAAAASSLWGVDPATGTPDLYPELTYDSFYGSETATSNTNYFSALLQQVSPQISTLQEVMTKTSILRSEAYANPSKLPYLIGDSLGFPWIPYQENLDQLKIQQSNDQYDMASAAVSQSLQQNSLAPLKGYSGYLPYSGYEVNKNELQDLINSALASNQQSGLDIPAADQTALPYSSPYVPEYLIAGTPPTPSDEESTHSQGGEQTG